MKELFRMLMCNQGLRIFGRRVLRSQPLCVPRSTDAATTRVRWLAWMKKRPDNVPRMYEGAVGTIKK